VRITPHFDSGEFAQPARHGFSRCLYPEEWIESRLRPLCEQLEIIRAAVGAPVQILSGYRSKEYNVRINGAKKSRHMTGEAADIRTARETTTCLHETILRLCNGSALSLVRGLGFYERGGFVHVDIRPSERLARWTGGRMIA